MTTVIDNVATGLRNIGYKVNFSPQEKLANKEVVILIDDLDIEVETAGSYFFTQSYSINWFSDSSSTIITQVTAIVDAVETAVVTTCRDFQFTKPTINIEGTAYIVSLKFSFKEVITV